MKKQENQHKYVSSRIVKGERELRGRICMSAAIKVVEPCPEEATLTSGPAR